MRSRLAPYTAELLARLEAVAERHYGGDTGLAAAVVFGFLAVESPASLARTLDVIDDQSWPDV